MKKYIITLAVLILPAMLSFAQEKRYEMVIQKTSGTEIILNPEDVLGVSFEKRESPQEGYLTCPDDNHPHMIDLGLSSGTLWACCNVGASTPEGYGGYYAWGETEEKDYYDWSTYIHCDGSSSSCHDLGDDIAGTQYDVAHVKWGGSWVMPSSGYELTSECTSEWTSENGVKGLRITGSNGGSIFLPAAGGIIWWDWDELDDVGTDGHYWTSTQEPWYLYFAVDMNFNLDHSDSGYWYFPADFRSNGRTVRPVSFFGPPVMLIQMKDGRVIKIVIEDISSISFREKEESQDGYLTCPDDNHPHMIDLGLPSGTLWACCNVGATTPEGYGGYYAWGETEEKDYYDWETYIHCDGDWDTCHDLGDDIAGTQYDVAHVKWGGSWVMPSLDQIKELLNNSTSKWVTENGVNGRRFTGSNGGSIFLPAAGGRWYDDPDDAGFSGVYWSSTQNPWNSGGAYFLFFYSDNAYWDFIELYYGSTVRPVSR